MIFFLSNFLSRPVKADFESDEVVDDDDVDDVDDIEHDLFVSLDAFAAAAVVVVVVVVEAVAEAVALTCFADVIEAELLHSPFTILFSLLLFFLFLNKICLFNKSNK